MRLAVPVEARHRQCEGGRVAHARCGGWRDSPVPIEVAEGYGRARCCRCCGARNEVPIPIAQQDVEDDLTLTDVMPIKNLLRVGQKFCPQPAFSRLRPRLAALQIYAACRTISRFLYPCGRQPFIWAGHCCPALATYPRVHRSGPLLLSYLVLLRVGFALPAGLLRPRCALTAPFRPYLNRRFRNQSRRYIFCCTFRKNSVARTLP